MENSETTLARWEVRADQVIFNACLVLGLFFFLFAFSLFSIYLISQSTNILVLLLPILLFFIFLSVLPEFFKSVRSAPVNMDVHLTDKGVYRKLTQEEQYRFIPWGQMNAYDMHYVNSTSILGKLFLRPTEFILKSKYEEDNFSVSAFGEDVDTLRAYLRENNVPFGFLV